MLNKLNIRPYADGIQRVIGTLAIITKTGPASKKPLMYRLLKLLGVLETLPESWEDSERVEMMPWGAKAMKVTPAIQPPGFDGIWPQEPVVDPRFSAPTLNLGRDEREPHRRYNVTRYLGQVIALTPLAAIRTIVGPRLAALDEKTFQWILTETSFAQYINLQLDPIDKQTFAALIGSDDYGRYAKLDCTGIETGNEPLPGVYVVPTVTLLRHESGDDYRVVAIQAGNEVFTPRDGAAWELARYFVLQGLQLLLVVMMHPRLHFPSDAINTISQMTLPRGHLLYKLLIPHTTYTLGLHEAVVHHRRSVVHNSQREVYTPFPLPTQGIHDGVACGLHGIAGNSSYQPYQFGSEVIGSHTAYGRFRSQWFDHILTLTTQVTNRIPKHDLYVKQWAHHIQQWLPGFPDGDEIFAKDRLAWATAIYIANVSVFHTGDHYSYSRIPLKYLPFRVRHPGPQEKRPDKLKLDDLVSREDFFRHQLCNAMFFKPTVLENLKDVRYFFRDTQLKQAENDFIAGMDALDQRWSATTFPSSQEIAISLQY